MCSASPSKCEQLEQVTTTIENAKATLQARHTPGQKRSQTLANHLCSSVDRQCTQCSWYFQRMVDMPAPRGAVYSIAHRVVPRYPHSAPSPLDHIHHMLCHQDSWRSFQKPLTTSHQVFFH